MKAGGYTKLSQGLDSFYTANCTSGDTIQLNQGDLDNDLYDRVQIYAMGGLGITNTDNVPAPPCNCRAASPRSAARRTRTPATCTSIRGSPKSLLIRWASGRNFPGPPVFFQVTRGRNHVPGTPPGSHPRLHPPITRKLTAGPRSSQLLALAH